MSKRLTGLNALAYQGVEASSPPQLVVVNRSPTNHDKYNFNLGALWLRKNPQEVWILVSLFKDANDVTQATWVQLFPGGGGGGANSFPTDAGTATPLAGVLNEFGGTNINTVGAGNTITINLNNSVTLSGTLTITSLGAGVVQTTAGGMFFSNNGTNGQVLIGGGAAPSWQNITSTGGSVTITNGANSINLETAGGSGGVGTFHTDAGDATVAANAITIHGGSNIGTTGAGSTVTINLDNSISVSGSIIAGTTITAGTGLTVSSFGAGVVQTNAGGVFSSTKGTDGQVLISSSIGVPVWNTITAGTGITVTNGANSITIAASGGVSPGTSCAFLVCQNTTVSGVTGDGTTYTLGTSSVLTKIYDLGTNFFVGTGVGGAATFTAPVTAKYMFSFYPTLSSSTVAQFLPITVQIVTTARTYIRSVNRDCDGNGAILEMEGFSVLADMTAGNTATFTVMASTLAAGTVNLVGGGATTSLKTWISGYQVTS